MVRLPPSPPACSRRDKWEPVRQFRRSSCWSKPPCGICQPRTRCGLRPGVTTNFRHFFVLSISAPQANPLVPRPDARILLEIAHEMVQRAGWSPFSRRHILPANRAPHRRPAACSPGERSRRRDAASFTSGSERGLRCPPRHLRALFAHIRCLVTSKPGAGNADLRS